MKNINDKIIYVILAVVVLVAFKSPEDSKRKLNQDRLITVTGSADMLVPPDEISIDISYQEYWYNSRNKEKATIDQIEKKIIKAANKAGISKESIVINSTYAWRHHWNYWYYWYDYHNYLNQKNLTIKLKSSSQLNEIIKNLKDNSIRKNGITNIQLSGSSNKKIQEYRKMVKEKAIQAANEKADYLLQAVNEKRGRVVSIVELNDPQKRVTTQSYGWPYYGHTSVTSNSSTNMISNSSVSTPSNNVATNGNDLSMKPIHLRYEIKAVFEIN